MPLTLLKGDGFRPRLLTVVQTRSDTVIDEEDSNLEWEHDSAGEGRPGFRRGKRRWHQCVIGS